MVNWSLPAKNDLKNIYDYIARDSKYYAKKVEILTIIHGRQNFDEKFER
jgi:plasmid stabilization system protein ParE